MAMVDLAKNSQGHPAALADIADRQGISLLYLEQLFAKLRSAELVNSVRGPGGGYLLAWDAADMPISDLIGAVDEALRATRCSPGSPRCCNGGQDRCLTHYLWDELSKHIHLFLSSVTLYDMVEGRVRGSGLLAVGIAA
jgi:Rrf2 family iron-sulfur cluster assembly transcriptional regulator